MATRRPIRLLGLCLLWLVGPATPPASAQPELPDSARDVIGAFCTSCHDNDVQRGNLNLASALHDGIAQRADVWERVLRKLVSRQMPPLGKPRPSEAQYASLISALVPPLDAAAIAAPKPGTTDTFRRLNRTEFRNVIRDLLGVEIDPASFLPKDEASHGFDTVTQSSLSPTLLSRWLVAAEKISRLALGAPQKQPGGDTFRIRPDLTQEEHIEGLPLGTRGGGRWTYTFPRDGDYEVQVRLARDRNEEVEGLHGDHELHVLLDRQLVQSFTVSPPGADRNFEKVDAHLKARFHASAGTRDLGVTFVKDPTPVLSTRRQPYAARFNMHRHPRQSPAVYQVSILGPLTEPQETLPIAASSLRSRILPRLSANPTNLAAAAEQDVSSLLRRALRRPVTAEDVAKPMAFIQEALRAPGPQSELEPALESAVSTILVHPEFLFRIERSPPSIPSGAVYRVDDIALASRLSFFLWSSLPDDELLSLAEQGLLHHPANLERQVRRMLADPRAVNLAENFAAQWLHLRNLDTFTPDLRLFPDFDDNLRQALRRETELHFLEILQKDRSILQLLRTDHTYLNERLARHYGIPHVLGSHFRQVALRDEDHRGGLLRQGSLLAVTSYATRTSPVLRGAWILGNLLGNPPPPPPPDVPALEEVTAHESLPVRERLARHRANPACASCHDLMDPVGFALENFDAVGRWRTHEEGTPVDVSGALPDGSRFQGADGLEEGLLRRPELLIGTLAEKLLTFALGRGMDPSDAPAVRQIVRETRSQGDRFSAIILAIVRSTPFTHRTAP